MLAENNVSGLFTAQRIIILYHVLVYVFVTNSGLLIFHAHFIAGFV